MQKLKEFIEQALASPENRLDPQSPEPAFGPPLVGVASGDDPIWQRIKENIGEPFWLPQTAFALGCPDKPVKAGDLRVVAWILPQTKATKADHKREKALPSKRWSLVRHYGEMFNEALRRKVLDYLQSQGHAACAPVLLPEFGYRESASAGICSNWSERHAAFVAGLGTFGLSDGLITERGKAVRVGTLITTANLEVTPRPYGDDHRAYCLFFRTGGRCMVCAKRCPAKAIGPHGHDKPACKAYIRGVTSQFVKDVQLGFAVNSCGLCQAGVPCESAIPKLKTG